MLRSMYFVISLAQVFKQTFLSLENRELDIVYPVVNIDNLLRPLSNVESTIKTKATTVFLSLNRYERKKNISLAIRALGKL